MRKSTKTHWSRVSEKLKGLSKVVLDMSVPVAIQAATEKACSIINEKLHKMYKNTFMNSMITLVLNIASMLIVFFNPFGSVVSKYIAAVFFSCLWDCHGNLYNFSLLGGKANFITKYGGTNLL